MQRCSKKAFAMCTTRHLCGRIDDATFTDDSECAAFNKAVEDKPMTNADRIRAMSDDELAYFLNNWADSKAWKRDPGTTNGWLLEPAEGEWRWST